MKGSDSRRPNRKFVALACKEALQKPPLSLDLYYPAEILAIRDGQPGDLSRSARALHAPAWVIVL